MTNPPPLNCGILIHERHPRRPCVHVWTPEPADAASAVLLVGLCRCLRCQRVSTRDDMEAFGRMMKREATFGEVMHNYDVLRGA